MENKLGLSCVTQVKLEVVVKVGVAFGVDVEACGWTKTKLMLNSTQVKVGVEQSKTTRHIL